MVTNPEEIESPPTKTEKAVDAAYAARDSLVGAARYAVTGDPRGRVRRGVLFLLAALGLFVGYPFAIVGLLAVLLLAFTDNVIVVPSDE